MAFSDCLEIAADFSAIVTAVVAASAYWKFRHDRSKRRKAFERYLRNEKLRDPYTAQKSLLHLMAQLSMTEAETMAAGFDAVRKGTVETCLKNDDHGYAQKILFEYVGSDVPEPSKL